MAFQASMPMKTSPRSDANVEPWMRGTHAELDPLRRGVVHALEMCEEDAVRWVSGLDDTEMFARPFDLPSAAFHLRHIVRSLDRLLTYAEDSQLSEAQFTALKTEMDGGSASEVLTEFMRGLTSAKERVRAFTPDIYGKPRGIGRKRLPTTVGGLLLHCAEHTQRHSGQMVTTAKLAVHLRKD